MAKGFTPFSLSFLPSNPKGSGPGVGVKTGRWGHPFGFYQEFRAGRDLVKPGEFACGLAHQFPPSFFVKRTGSTRAEMVMYQR